MIVMMFAVLNKVVQINSLCSDFHDLQFRLLEQMVLTAGGNVTVCLIFEQSCNHHTHPLM